MKGALETTEEAYLQALNRKICVMMIKFSLLLIKDNQINNVKNKVREILEAEFFWLTQNQIPQNLHSLLELIKDKSFCVSYLQEV